MTSSSAFHRLDREDGFTLVELLVTLVVIAVGVLALAGVQTRSSSSVYSSGRHERALAIGQERMEIARSAGHAGAATSAGQSGVFAWNAQVDSIDVGLKQVVVTVTWPESKTTQSLRLHTLLSAR